MVGIGSYGKRKGRITCHGLGWLGVVSGVSAKWGLVPKAVFWAGPHRRALKRYGECAAVGEGVESE